MSEREVDWTGRSICGGKIEVLKRIGQGGMGAVYEGVLREDGARVAVKFLLQRIADIQIRLRFEREGRRFGRIEHPNVVAVLDHGQEDGVPFIVSRFVEGETVGQHLDERQSFEVSEALRITRQVAQGLAAAHEHRFVHRDLKPDNVMIRASDGVAMVFDFGIAKTIEDPSIKTGKDVYLGTPGYSSPEQIHGSKIDERSDIFSLGVMIYEMLTGRAPFEDERTTLIFRRTMRTEPPLDSAFGEDVSKPVVELIRRMLMKRPEKRPRTMRDVVKRIEKIEKKLGHHDDGARKGLRQFLRAAFGLGRHDDLED